MDQVWAFGEGLGPGPKGPLCGLPKLRKDQPTATGSAVSTVCRPALFQYHPLVLHPIGTCKAYGIGAPAKAVQVHLFQGGAGGQWALQGPRRVLGSSASS
jgi:hypothetical protein